jgi:antitoxin MazE
VNARIQRWGNSLALRLPKAIVERVGVVEGSSVELEAREGRLVLRPVHQYRLADLLEGIRPDNLHTENEFGQRTGIENW